MATRTDRIAALLRDGTVAGGVPGVAVAAVFPDGEVVSAAAGVRDVASGAEMRPDSVVWIASMTKAITAAAAMQLVEQGKLALDAPIATVLPQLANPQVLEGFDAAGKPKLRPSHTPITLRHLLTHSSGFVYDMWNADMARYLEVTGKPGIISCANAALDLPLVFDPGDRLGLRHRHRLGRQGRGGRHWQDPGRLARREPVRPAWHARHGVSHPRRPAHAPGADLCPHAGGDRRHRPGNSPVAGIRNGRRRSVRHGIGTIFVSLA